MDVEKNDTPASARRFAHRGKHLPPVEIGALNSSFLDICRGTAASIVVFAHAQDIYGIGPGFRVHGTLGVTVFFLLSGFLIAISLSNHLSKDHPHLSSFLSDRIARITTPFIPTLCLVALLNAFLSVGNWGQFGENRGVYAFIGNALLLNDYPVFQALSNKWIVTSYYVRSYNTAEPFWTIPIEFWIYVGAGLFSFIALARERVRPAFKWAGILISAPVIVWNAFAGGGKCLTLIWLLGAAFGGMWIALKRNQCGAMQPAGALLLLFGATSLAGRILKVPFDPFDLQTAALIGCCLFGVSFLLEGLRERKVLRQAGTIASSYSYSLYLVHNTVLIIVFESSSGPSLWTYFGAIISAHIAAIAIYFLFERHYRRVSLMIRPALAALCSPQDSGRRSWWLSGTRRPVTSCAQDQLPQISAGSQLRKVWDEKTPA